MISDIKESNSSVCFEYDVCKIILLISVYWIFLRCFKLGRVGIFIFFFDDRGYCSSGRFIDFFKIL